mmetsp:Transcript_35681/g.93323  ORF Transcript_35681/g.93323 Transcript_35681/m.93323 type:complete len:242 (-) Transcript_35681:354-1079(-)
MTTNAIAPKAITGPLPMFCATTPNSKEHPAAVNDVSAINVPMLPTPNTEFRRVRDPLTYPFMKAAQNPKVKLTSPKHHSSGRCHSRKAGGAQLALSMDAGAGGGARTNTASRIPAPPDRHAKRKNMPETEMIGFPKCQPSMDPCIKLATSLKPTSMKRYTAANRPPRAAVTASRTALSPSLVRMLGMSPSDIAAHVLEKKTPCAVHITPAPVPVQKHASRYTAHCSSLPGSSRVALPKRAA